MEKILVVFGTRPEAIKMAPVVLALEESKDFQVEVAVTAQHRELLDQVLSLFGISPDFDLDLMTPGQSLHQLTARIMIGMEEVFQQSRPDCVLVHGDTTTSFAAALAAFYAKVPIGHIEAGLRSGSLDFPYPEEGNRVLISRLANWHFAPTEGSAENLRKEGIPDEKIVITGNTVIDALEDVAARPKNSEIQQLLGKAQGRRILLMEAHRRESWGEPLENICLAAKELIAEFNDLHIFFSVHPNPKVQATVKGILGGLERVELLAPLPYDSWVQLMEGCHLIATDSGGMQEEAPALGKPVVVLRERTERPEGLTAGTLILAGTEGDVIFEKIAGILNSPQLYEKMATAPNPYGDGTASLRIVQALSFFAGRRERPEEYCWH